jgi:hypothetical protein
VYVLFRETPESRLVEFIQMEDNRPFTSDTICNNM